MSHDDEQEVVPAEQEPEEPETPEEETLEEPEEQPEQPEEPKKGFEEQFKDQQKRANKYEGFLKQNGIDPKTGRRKEQPRAPKKEGNVLSEEDSNRVNRSEDRSERAILGSMGYTHPDDIAYIRKAAKSLDVDVEDAPNDEFVKSKLERMKAARDTNDATPQPNRRSGSSRSTTKLPDFSKMTNAEFDEWERKNRA